MAEDPALTAEDRQQIVDVGTALGTQAAAVMQTMATAMIQALQEFAQTLEPQMRALAAAAAEFQAICMTEYRAAGAPYGDTEAGMWRWLQERARAQRLEDEAADIRAWHTTLAELRYRQQAARL
jgi:hypothetical protein